MKKEEIKFEPGGWYKYSGWYLKFSHIREDSGNIFVASEAIDKDKVYRPNLTNFGAADSQKVLLTDLSEIYLYLPDGHPDKKFIFPEKWCIKTCKEVGDWLDECSDMVSDKRLPGGYGASNFKYLNYPSHNGSHIFNTILSGYVEITLEQFRKYVLKEKEKEKFVLPEKWLIKITEENKETLSDWRYCGSLLCNPIGGYCLSNYNDARGYYIEAASYPKFFKEGYVEITFEQFKKYVLGEDDKTSDEVLSRAIEDKFIVGKIYRIEDSGDKCICKYEKMSDNDRMAGYYISNMGECWIFVNSTPWITGRKVSEATEEECIWLEACIKANKFIELKDVNPKIEYIVREWPSGTLTMGCKDGLHFKSLETYDKEGGVIADKLYGLWSTPFEEKLQRDATEDEIKYFLEHKTLTTYKIADKDWSKATKEELLEEAKRGYPVGTKFISSYDEESSFEVISYEYYWYGEHDIVVNSLVGPSVYTNGKWAEIISAPEVEVKVESFDPNNWQIQVDSDIKNALKKFDIVFPKYYNYSLNAWYGLKHGECFGSIAQKRTVPVITKSQLMDYLKTLEEPIVEEMVEPKTTSNLYSKYFEIKEFHHHDINTRVRPDKWYRVLKNNIEYIVRAIKADDECLWFSIGIKNNRLVWHKGKWCFHINEVRIISELTDLSSIQKFLPDGHPDKIKTDIPKEDFSEFGGVRYNISDGSDMEITKAVKNGTWSKFILNLNPDKKYLEESYGCNREKLAPFTGDNVGHCNGLSCSKCPFSISNRNMLFEKFPQFKFDKKEEVKEETKETIEEKKDSIETEEWIGWWALMLADDIGGNEYKKGDIAQIIEIDYSGDVVYESGFYNAKHRFDGKQIIKFKTKEEAEDYWKRIAELKHNLSMEQPYRIKLEFSVDIHDNVNSGESNKSPLDETMEIYSKLTN